MAFLSQIAIYPFERFAMFAGGQNRTYTKTSILGESHEEIASNSLLSRLFQMKATCHDYRTYSEIYTYYPASKPFTVVRQRVQNTTINTDTVCHCL